MRDGNLVLRIHFFHCMDSKGILRILSRDKNNTFSLIKTEHTRFTCWLNLFAGQEETEAGMGRSKSWYGSVKTVSKISMRLRGKPSFLGQSFTSWDFKSSEFISTEWKGSTENLCCHCCCHHRNELLDSLPSNTRKCSPHQSFWPECSSGSQHLGAKPVWMGKGMRFALKSPIAASMWSWKIRGESSAGQQMKQEPVLAPVTYTGLWRHNCLVTFRGARELQWALLTEVPLLKLPWLRRLLADISFQCWMPLMVFSPGSGRLRSPTPCGVEPLQPFSPRS